MIGLVVAQTIAFVLSAALHCPPSKWAHDPLYLLSCSASIKAFTLASGALSILTDVLTYTLPIPVILKLHMPSNQKAYIIIILGLGVVACASSVVRLVYGADLMKFPPDAVSIAGTFYWTSIEMNLAILAASIPSFKAIASRLFPWLIGEYPSKELQRPLRSGNTDDSERLRPFRRQRQSVAMSVLYTQNSDIGSPVDPTHSEERIPMSDGAIITQVVFEMSDKPHRGSENVQQNI
ncbi:hypothetical protein BDV28DRAFT_127520 [Aspergillus coremiiformis]|uniref:Rhodopsin domain-containing protein n=1 Tax=Aspergillus coremiiformis TaxID=138285 RepID=A0A5N6ZFD4_9EURO|nr:hypothetical protein BDV28DRAFT_127520 [Aspergillus coremiiformis]